MTENIREHGTIRESCILRISQNSQENACAKVSFLIKLVAWSEALLEKKTLTQTFS